MTKKRDGKIRRQLFCTYTIPAEHGIDLDLTAYASRGTYLLKGERFLVGLHIYEARQRRRLSYGDGGRHSLGDRDRWAFDCKQIRKLTRDEYVNDNRPREVKGRPW